MQKHLSKLAYCYVFASVLIGPIVAMAGSRMFPQRLACFDIERNLPHQDIINNARSQFYFDSIISLTLIVIGIWLISRLWLRKYSANNLHRDILTIGICLMIMGYSLIIALSYYTWDCASS